MDSNKKIALDIAKEITIAKMENSTIRVDEVGGTAAADFFDEIYKRVLTIVQSEN